MPVLLQRIGIFCQKKTEDNIHPGSGPEIRYFRRVDPMNRPFFFRFCFLLVLSGTAAAQGIGQNVYWSDATLAEEAGPRRWKLNAQRLVSYWENGPFRFPLPQPDGSTAWALLQEDTTLLPAPLSARYPGIRIFNGHILGHSGQSVRLDYGPNGLHVRISGAHAWSISPRSGFYVSQWENTGPKDRPFYCQAPGGEGRGAPTDSLTWIPLGDTLITYRLAIAATGEYSRYFDGDKAKTLAAMATALNRINGIFERDLNIRFQLVPQNDTLFFVNPDTDPFGGDLLLGNTELFNRYLGVENYDLGHVFSIGESGAALLEGVCDDNRKAGGFSSFRDPEDDRFFIDFFAHELGHQLGAEHTFNNCGFAGPVPYEPGSGSTIMSYAGLCQENDLAQGVDAYFHAISQIQIATLTRRTAGKKCGKRSPTGNTDPQVFMPPGETVPYGTPFELEGGAFDLEADSLTFCWEQWDTGPRVQLDSVFGSAPLFRSFLPRAESHRHFPRIAFLMGEDNRPGEGLPEYPRDLNFRLTVRDHAGGVGSGLMNLKITDQSGPFRVLPFANEVRWVSGNSYTLLWEVAGTDELPVLADSVLVLFSRDGGATFGDTLAQVPNLGVVEVQAPEVRDSLFRGVLKIKAKGKSFFALYPDFIAVFPGQVTSLSTLGESSVPISLFPNPSRGRVFLDVRLKKREKGSCFLVDALGKTFPLEEELPGQAGKNHWEISLPNLPDGLYWLVIRWDGHRQPSRVPLLIQADL